MPKYAISTFGRSYVTDEELDELPLTRQLFMLFTFLLGTFTLLKILLQLYQLNYGKDKTCNYRPLNTSCKRIVICYIISHLIHTIHFIDNIWRPVDYYEPKWLYDKYLISEMEITFFINFPITLSGFIFMSRFITAVSKRNLSQAKESTKKMFWYIFGSSLTLGHYRVEPPWTYDLIPTITIAGEGIAGLFLAIWLYRYFKFAKRVLNNEGQLGDEEGHSLSMDSKQSKTL